MKILHFLNIYQKGSVAQIIGMLNAEKSTLVSHRVSSLDPPKNILAEKDTLLNMVIGSRYNLMKIEAALKNIHNNESIDCIHAHMGWAMAIAPWISYRLQLPCVITFHNELNHYHALVRGLLQFRTAGVHYTAVSQAVALQWSRYLGRPVHTIYNPVLLPLADPDAMTTCDVSEGIRLVVVARLTPQKQLDFALGLLAKLIEAGHSATLNIVGDGPERMKLERLCVQLGLVGNCRFIGYQSNVQRWLDAADFFLLPSKHEGFCMAAVEALARGCILVTHPLPAVVEYAEDGVNSVVAESLNHETWANRIIEIAANPDRMLAMKKNAVVSVAARFHPAHITRHYENIYSVAIYSP